MRDIPQRQSSLVGDLLDDVSIGLDNDLVDLERGLDGLGLLVDPFEFLEGTTLRFNTIPVTQDYTVLRRGRHTQTDTNRETRTSPNRRKSKSSGWRCSGDRSDWRTG